MRSQSLFLPSLFLLFALASAAHSASSDTVGELINQEKTAQSAWKQEEGDLPPLILIGDGHGVLVYQAGLERANAGLLCSDISFDELFETAAPSDPNATVEVNTALDRIRETIEDHCMVRPGDPLIAVGPGWQEIVTVKAFEIRPDRSGCPDDPKYSLWVTYDGAIPDVPYFFMTDVSIPTGANKFSAAADWKPTPLTPLLRNRVSPEVSFIDEYDGEMWAIGQPNCDHLIHLTKKRISPDDNDLPNEVLLAEKEGTVQLLLVERVDLSHGSGHLKPVATFDLDHDTDPELVVEGDHQGCLFRAAFRGREFGFERLALPVLACSCH